MVIGTTLFKLDGNAYHSPEFPRGGLAATLVCDLTHLQGGPTVTISIEHRNEDDTAFTEANTFSSIRTVGIATRNVTDIKEIVRFKYAFAAGDDATDAIHFLMQSPTWKPY